MVNANLSESWAKYRAACVGKWFIETDKGVRLYCEAVDDHGPRMSYRPGDPIAVSPQWANFGIYFKEAPPAPAAPLPLPIGAKYGVERCLEWLKTRAVEIESEVDDGNAGSAKWDRAHAAHLRTAARDMAEAFGVEWKR